MSSKPSGLRFSSVSSQTTQPQSVQPSANFAKTSTIAIVGKKPSTIVYTKNIKSSPSQIMQATKKLQANQSPYGNFYCIFFFYGIIVHAFSKTLCTTSDIFRQNSFKKKFKIQFQALIQTFQHQTKIYRWNSDMFYGIHHGQNHRVRKT